MGRNRYKVPKEVYHQCVWVLKDVDRLRRLEAAFCYDHSGAMHVFFSEDDETIRSREVLEQACWKMECIRKAIDKVPIEYRQHTVDCIVYNLPFNTDAHENTWRKWRQIFIKELAENLMLI